LYASQSCFFLGKHISSFERFLSENNWNHNQLLSLLIKQIIEKLGQKAKVANAYLFALDTLLVAKASKQMPWKFIWDEILFLNRLILCSL